MGVEIRPATFADLDELLADDWLVGIDLNEAVLNGQQVDKYIGHMVVVFDHVDGQYWLHDPGLEPHSNQQIGRQKLADAWFWSGQRAASLVAVKLNESS